MRKYLVISTLALSLCACGGEPADAPATELRDATQKPIDATSQAVQQVQRTNQSMVDALDSLEKQQAAQAGQVEPVEPSRQ